MPTYTYRCENCEYQFERFQNITETPLKECPKCKRAIKRLIGTGGGIIFKGTGFYQTDYCGSASKSEGKSDTNSKTAVCGKAGNCPYQG